MRGTSKSGEFPKFDGWPRTNRRFEFNKRRQLFLSTHNEALPIAAMRVSNKDCSPVGIHG